MTSTTRIAIIDNDLELLGLLAEVLADHDWDTIPISDGLLAFEHIKTALPDLVILDLWLEAARSGWDLIQTIQEDPATAAIPIVVCSGDTRRLDDRRTWLEQRRIAVVQKPFDIDDLYSVIETALERTRTLETG